MKRVAAVVAAAGLGRRYGAGRKLQAALDGRPVLAWTIELLGALAVAQRVVVVAPDDETAAALAGAVGAEVVVNPSPALGLGASIACGVRAVPDDLDGVLVLLGDMPRVRAATCEAMLARFEALGATAAIAPVHQGRRGHPVLFGAAHFAALRALHGDRGARAVLDRAQLTSVDVDDPGILLDIDTPADLAAASHRSGP